MVANLKLFLVTRVNPLNGRLDGNTISEWLALFQKRNPYGMQCCVSPLGPPTAACCGRAFFGNLSLTGLVLEHHAVDH
jgi:hypothetical protein